MPHIAPALVLARSFQHLAFGSAAMAAPVAVIAGRHLELTARYGSICGLPYGGHCWACYAAAGLAGAAALSWAISVRLASLAHVRA